MEGVSAGMFLIIREADGDVNRSEAILAQAEISLARAGASRRGWRWPGTRWRPISRRAPGERKAEHFEST